MPAKLAAVTMRIRSPAASSLISSMSIMVGKTVAGLANRAWDAAVNEKRAAKW